ncbi:hypothetical protein [Brevundimonas sp. FT23042]|uniref:ApeP family dehydratase n=1 Tax=Brevundimonas sp. FT23042 TaxID=3393749 RepID=UPI003B5891A5
MTSFPPIEDLIVHRSGMLLIDRVISREDEVVTSEVVIRSDQLFFQPGRGVPAYVGFELMAQTISASDGLTRREMGLEPGVGLLLGCRKYAVDCAFFCEGEHLRIEATPLLSDEGMTAFRCRILDAVGGERATATINAYRPDDLSAFLRSQQ